MSGEVQVKCADVYELFFEPGEVTEIRAYGCRGKNRAWEGWAGHIVSGFFDNAEAFGRAALALEATKAPGIYFTIQPLIPAILAQCKNRLRGAKEGDCAGDRHVLCLRWLYIDIDPVRPGGLKISTTDKELDAAVKIRARIAKWMEQECHWPPGIRAHSGNGVHLHYRLPDVENDVEKEEGAVNVQLIKSCLKALDQKFTNKWAQVDLLMFNPSRICKLYGTTARKGDDTEDRPHRKSYVEIP